MPVITISRGSMSGGKALAECVAGTLGLPCIGREILEEAATNAGVSTELLTTKMERSPGLWERVTSARKTYLLAVQAELGEHAARGDLVYHGLAGHLLLAGMPGLLRVRLIAPPEMRVQNLVERHGLSREAAVEYIEQVDEERVRWTRLVYGVELRDSSRFDLVLNLERLSLDTACRLVASAAAAPEYRLGDEERARYRAFALHCRAELEAARSGPGAAEARANCVIVATDDLESASPLVAELGRRSARVTVVALGTETEACVVAAPFDALLACSYRPSSNLLDVLRAVRTSAPTLPVVVVAAHAAVDARIEAMQLGAADFLDHPQPAETVAEAVDAAMALGRAARRRAP